MERRRSYSPYGSFSRQLSPDSRQYTAFTPRHDVSPPPPKRSRSRFSERQGSEFSPREPVDRDGDEDGTLYFSDCVMFPPRLGIDKPIKQKTSKPTGCKTLYLGGIPESLNRTPKRLEAIIHEVFTANGGEIETIRVSGRGFCHIRFMKEANTEIAMSVCGYWMEVKQQYEPSTRFRIALDYAESQSDAEEYEAKRLVASRLNLNSTSVPSIPSFKTSSAEVVSTDLKDPVRYIDAVIVLRYWMSSNLNRQTSVRFFNLLQISSAQIKRLQNERAQLDREHKDIKQRYEGNVDQLNKEFDHLFQLFTDAHQQKIWDNFSKAQRKSIDQWLNAVRASISISSAYANSKGPSPSLNKAKASTKNIKSVTSGTELRENEVSSQEITALKESLACMQRQVWEMVAKLQTKDSELEEKQKEIDELKVSAMEQLTVTKKKPKEKSEAIDLETAKLIGAAATFLQVYPEGATLVCLEKYLKEECCIKLTGNDVESRLLKMTGLFVHHTQQVDGKSVTKWRYVNNYH